MASPIDPRQTLVIVPTAGRVPAELVPFTQSRHSAMIRLQRKPVIYWTMEYLLREGFDKFSFAVERPHNVVQAFVEHLAGWRSQLFFSRPDVERGVAYSVLCALRAAADQGCPFQSVLLVLGDTYFRFPPEALECDTSWLLTAAFDPSQDEARDWCLVQPGQQGLEYLNKQTSASGADWSIVAGVYYFAEAGQLLSTLERLEVQNQCDELHRVLELYAEKKPLNIIACQDWYDCGHLPNLMRSEQRLVKERSFNAIELDRVRGVLTKRSEHRQKLGDEIEYYQALPDTLRCLFPRVYEADPQGGWMTMEFYAYPSLSDCFVFDLLHPRLWKEIFLRLKAVVSLFQASPVPQSSTATVRENCQQMYLAKTRERLTRLAQEPFWQMWLDRPWLEINGRRLRNAAELMQEAERSLPRLWKDSDWSVIHGDLCFSNILFDIPTGTCRLIDPRGSFGEAGIFGDIKYDIAKLSHSVRGSYDFITNDLFFIKAEDGKVDFRVYNHNHEVRKIFEEIFFEGTDFQRTDIQLIEGLLFLSMLPLHTESRERQLAMFATGLELLNSVFEEARV